MFERIAGMVEEIAAEIGIEITHVPLRILAEVVQFAILVGIVWFVAIGFGKRRGFVANMLTERAQRTAARVEGASLAEATLAEARHQATKITRAGRAKAREIVAQVKKECVQIESTARAETDVECARIEERAESALSTEQQEMLLELRDQLIDLVSSATRAIMNEKLTVAEQRTLIENSIAGSMAASSGTDGRIAARSVTKGA